MAQNARAFVERRTRLRPVPCADWIRLHLVDDAMGLWVDAHTASGDPDEPIPFWGIAWGGGLAITRYLRDHPEAVAGRRVLDIASGSGLCAIAAAGAGAARVVAADVDRYAIAAIGLNARANRVRIETAHVDMLAGDPPQNVDVVLAGDCWYEEPFASTASAWLRRCREAGIDVLIGDPGRRHCATTTSSSWPPTTCAAPPRSRTSAGPAPGSTPSPAHARADRPARAGRHARPARAVPPPSLRSWQRAPCLPSMERFWGARIAG